MSYQQWFQRSLRVVALSVACVSPSMGGEGYEVQFAIEGTTALLYDDVKALEHQVSQALAQHCQQDSRLRYWSPIVGESSDHQVEVTLSVKEDLYWVELSVRSPYLEVSEFETTTWGDRMWPPGEDQRVGAPERQEISGLVVDAVDRILAASPSVIFAAISSSFPLGSLDHEAPPSKESNAYVTVLPIDPLAEENCALRNSTFEVRCHSQDLLDLRMQAVGTGVGTGYPPGAETVNGLRIQLFEEIQVANSALLHRLSEMFEHLQFDMFFLEELNESSHACHVDDFAVAILDP